MNEKEWKEKINENCENIINSFKNIGNLVNELPEEPYNEDELASYLMIKMLKIQKATEALF